MIGNEIELRFTGLIRCINCGEDTEQSYSQGYCLRCSQTLARCDLCIVKPEQCHYRKGTCREPAWGRENCLIKHAVYLSNTTGLKVGITREHQKLTRWGDQGALAATVLAHVPERYIAGLLEQELAKTYSDKTDWRGLIKGTVSEVDLVRERSKCVDNFPQKFRKYLIDDATVYTFEYPVVRYLEKAKTWNLDKDPNVKGTLHGIRGQYLLIGEAAFNVRKFAGYEVELGW